MNDTKMMRQTGTSHEVAILEKQGRFAVIALSTDNDGRAVQLGRNQPANACGGARIDQSHQESAAMGQRNFENSIRHSLYHGWRLAWRGFPYGK
jgi:hypothetical protein